MTNQSSQWKYVCLFWICTCFWGQAQVPFFKNHSLGESFGNTQVNVLLETTDAYLWFGTSDGLFRYDGQEFMRLPSPDSIAQYAVSALFEDRDQRVWIGCTSGAIYFMDNGKQLEAWQPEEGIPKVAIRGFAQSQNSTLWIATYGEGAYYLQDNRLYNINTDDGLVDNDIYTIKSCASNQIVLGTDGGINVCTVDKASKKILTLSVADGLPDEIVQTVQIATPGNFWIGMYDQGVCFYDGTTQSFASISKDWPHAAINCLEIVDDRFLWIGTNGTGLFRYDLQRKTLKPVDEQNLGKAKVFDLHHDREGNLWVISNSSGICSAAQQFEVLSHSLGNIQAVCTDQQDGLWVGTPDGLFSYDIEEAKYNTFLKENVVSLYQDRLGYLWIGTFGDGLYCRNPKNGKLRHFAEKDGLTNGSILSIDGRDEVLWLATLGGVTELIYDSNVFENGDVAFRNYNHETSLGTNFIYSVFVDSQNKTWFGTDGKGISVLDNGEIMNYSIADSLPLKVVYSIAEDHRGHLWFSTAEHGLFEFDGQNFHHFGVEDGLRNLLITSLLNDANGQLIIVHTSGIDLLEPESRRLIYYDKEIGLQMNEPGLNAFSVNEVGEVWMGTQEQLIRYTPSTTALRTFPKTQIENVNIFFEPIDFLNTHTFSYHQNNLEFEYIGLWYTNPQKVKYRYQLEGYDLDWISSQDRQVTYSNLPPGEYTFKVSASENQVFDKRLMATYSFQIGKPLWQQWWIWLLAIVLLGNLIFLWIKSKESRLKEKASIDRERVKSQLEVLKSQINPHFLFNSFNTLIALVEEKDESAVKYIEHLSDFYRSILQYREKNIIPLEEEIDLFHNFTYLMKHRFGENLQFDFQVKESQGVYIVPLTLQILVENAIKHNVVSKSKPLNISIVKNAEWIIVSNNLQKKRTNELSTGFGLQSISSRYALLAKKGVMIDETNDRFVVHIPILNEIPT